MDPITLGLFAGGTSLLSGILGSRSARQAATTQAAAAERASQAQLAAQQAGVQAIREGTQQGIGLGREALGTQIGFQQPGMQVGQQALAALAGGFGFAAPQAIPGGATQQQLTQAAGAIPGQFTQQFTYGDLYKDPSYQFRLQEGLRAINASAAAKGFGGQTLKDITNYGQQAASQEYASAYDRFMRNQEALYSRLSGLTGIGQRAGEVASSAAGQFGAGGMQAYTGQGRNIAELLTGGARAASDYATSAAAAQAAGQVGTTQAITGGLNQGLQNWTTLQYLNRLPQVASASTVGAPQPIGTNFPTRIG